MIQAQKAGNAIIRNLKFKNESGYKGENMKARFYGGKYNGKEFDADKLELIPEWTGRYSKSYAGKKVAYTVPRKELWNRPIIDGYVGPMWDGDKLRYETQEVYNMMSE